MPLMTIEAFEGRTTEQKRQLAQDITEVVVRNFNVQPDAVTIVIHELRRENYAKAGKLAVAWQFSDYGRASLGLKAGCAPASLLWPRIYLRHRSTEVRPSHALKISSLQAQAQRQPIDPEQSIWHCRSGAPTQVWPLSRCNETRLCCIDGLRLVAG